MLAPLLHPPTAPAPRADYDMDVGQYQELRQPHWQEAFRGLRAMGNAIASPEDAFRQLRAHAASQGFDVTSSDMSVPAALAGNEAALGDMQSSVLLQRGSGPGLSRLTKPRVFEAINAYRARAAGLGEFLQNAGVLAAAILSTARQLHVDGMTCGPPSGLP